MMRTLAHSIRKVKWHNFPYIFPANSLVCNEWILVCNKYRALVGGVGNIMGRAWTATLIKVHFPGSIWIINVYLFPTFCLQLLCNKSIYCLNMFLPVCVCMWCHHWRFRFFGALVYLDLNTQRKMAHSYYNNMLTSLFLPLNFAPKQRWPDATK